MTQTANPALVAHTRNFRQDFVATAPNAWTAVGFAASNVHVIEGEQGLVIVDTTESTAAAATVLSALRQHTDKPVRTIVYTHGHRTHISGAAVFAEDRAVEVIAGPGFNGDPLMWGSASANAPDPTPARKLRSKRATGTGLPKAAQVSLGCGPALRPTEGFGGGYMPATHLIPKGGETIVTDGLELSFTPTAGYGSDHIVVWDEANKTLYCGDLWCHAFPNLYSLRGTPYRDLDHWADSLDDLMTLQPEVLCAGHTRPLMGKEAVMQALGDTRDAIRYIIATTADGLNAGKSVDALAAEIQLPNYLDAKPHLQQVYGRVDWAVRSYANGLMGWFDGNPSNLDPLHPGDHADRFLRLAGGAQAVLEEAEASDSPQWAMTLCDQLIAAGHLVAEARSLKVGCLEVLAENEENAQARNYYLSCAREMNV